MSLKQFLVVKDVRDKFIETFDAPSRPGKDEIKARPLTKNYSLVGTAFDYLLRFIIEFENKSIAQSGEWIANSALKKFFMKFGSLSVYVDNDGQSQVDFEDSISSLSQADAETARKIQGFVEAAKQNHGKFLHTGQITRELIESSIHLAQLDTLVRANVSIDTLGSAIHKDIADLRSLVSLVDRERFQAKDVCILNPQFGEASRLVNGADADLLIDDALIDIKTTPSNQFKRDHLNQLIGYYVLSRIGGIGSPAIKREIKRLGFYFSRYGQLFLFKVDEIMDDHKLNSFIGWFKERTESSNTRVS